MRTDVAPYADVKPYRIKMPVDYAAPSADLTAAVGYNR